MSQITLALVGLILKSFIGLTFEQVNMKQTRFIHLCYEIIIAENFKTIDDCGIKFGCFLSPPGCSNLTCDYLVKWAKVGDNSIHFTMSSKSSYQSYLAIGFSTDQIMV